MIIDVHCHYTFSQRAAGRDDRFSFEPAVEHGRAALDSFISPRIASSLRWKLMKFMIDLGAPLVPGEALDCALEEMYAKHLVADGPIDRFVLLAFDAYHDDRGQTTLPPRRSADFGSDIYSSNSLIRAACKVHPDRFLFGASVHPYRADAVACVEEVFAAGACLLKWLPLHQNIDVSDARSMDVLRKCAELGLPLLVHYGEEFTLTTHRRDLVSVRPLLGVLERLRGEGCMPTTIVAHVATPVTPLGGRDSHRALLEALHGPFADAPLYADISALTAWGKVGYLRRVLKQQSLHAKLLFGTDFPVPPALSRLRRDIGRGYRAIRELASWPQQVARALREMGLNEIVFQRAEQLLPHLDYFAALDRRP